MLESMLVELRKMLMLESGGILYGPTIMIVIIVVLWLFAWCGGKRILRRFADARTYVEQCRAQLGTGTLANLVVYIDQIQCSNRGSTEKEMVDEVIRDAAQRGSLEGILELVSNFSVREESRKSFLFLSFAAGSVLILGLAGTFLAFGELVSRSGVGQGSVALENSIPFIVSNLKLAFTASVAGVLTSVLLLYQSTVSVRHAKLWFFASLEQLLVQAHSRNCLGQDGEGNGAMQKALSDQLHMATVELSSAAKAIGGMAERVEKLSETTPEAIAVILSGILTELREGKERYQTLIDTAVESKNAVGSMAEDAGKVLRTVVEEFDRRLAQGFEQARMFSGELLKDIAARDEVRIGKYEEGLVRLTDGMRSVTGAWRSQCDELVSGFRTNCDAFAAELKALQASALEGFGEVSRKSLEGLEQAIHQFDETGKRVRENCEAVTVASVARLEQAYQDQVKDWGDAIELAHVQREAASELLALFQSHLEPMAGQLKSLQSQSVEALEAVRLSLNSVGLLPSSFDKVIGLLQNGIESVNTAAHECSDTIRRLDADATGVFRGVGARMETVSGQLGQVIELGRSVGLRDKPSWLSLMARRIREGIRKK